jgi:PAS domain S-box-containing protein
VSRSLPLSSQAHSTEIARLLAELDWSRSPIGDPEGWPQSLKTTVGLMLAAQAQIVLFWGPEFVALYNDSYAPTIGDKHPRALGRPARENWAELWDDLGPLLRDVRKTGRTFSAKDRPFYIERQRDRGETVYFDVSYSPVPEADGSVAGVLCIVAETTARVLTERRREALLQLDERLRNVTDTAELSFTASQLLGETLGAARVGYGVIDAAAGTVSVERNWSRPGVADVAGHHDLDEYGSYFECLLRGEAVAVTDVATDPRTCAKPEAFVRLGIRSFLDMPVVEEGRGAAILFVHSVGPRVWTDEEHTLVRDFAERTRAAIARRAAERELREYASRLAAAFSQAAAGFAEGDLDGKFFAVNDSYCEIVGRTREDLLSLRMQDITHPDDLQVNQPLFRAAAAGGPAFDIEKRYIRPDGSVVWVRNSVTGVRDAHDEVRSMLAVSVDITSRKNAEAALQTLNETLVMQVAARSAERDRLWDLSQDMLARADYTGMMSAVSPAWERVLGWSESELLSRGYASFMHPDDMPPTLEAITRMSQTMQPARFENRIATRDGGWKPIEWTVAPEPDGFNFIAVGRDLSEAKAREAELAAAQEQLRQSQKLESMGQLTGGVAHDFNNLLTPILGTLDMLQRGGAGGERERRLIAGAVQSAERARILVQRLLAFARRQPLQASPVDLAKLAHGMVELVASTTGPQIEVVVDAPDGLPLANTDPNQIEMAILNLAVNARDAMPRGGVLRIAVSAENVGTRHHCRLAPGRYLCMSVADTGTGMDGATLARAVEPFFSTKGIGKGTGLGLSMVHGLASQLGGALAIRSAPGDGTCVELWLPQSDDAAPAAEPDAVVISPQDRRRSVLLVDDEELVRLSTADMLSELGYEVREASSGEEALKLLERGFAPDILVTDHLMPGMSGTELARLVRQRSPDIRTLIVSGYAETDGIALDLPRLTKPFRNIELAACLSDLH